MKNLLARTMLLVLFIWSAHASAYITVAGLERTGGFAFSSGNYMQPARNSLTMPGNFGPGGIIADSVTILPDITGTITASKLAAVDVFITSGVYTSFSLAEATVVRDFVTGGGSLIFYGDVGVNFGDEANTMSSVFGITFSTDDFTDSPSVTINEPTHPTIDGPFGTSQFALDYTGSVIAQTNALTIATLSSGPSSGRPFMVVQDSSTGFPGTGRAIWFCDTNILADNFDLYTANEVLFLNTFTYAIPEPATVCLLGLGGLVLRRKRRA